MAYVIAEPCSSTQEAACLQICPIEGCIQSDGNRYYIDPNTCIDCGACEPACPVQAIFPADLVPPEWKDYVFLNADFFEQGANEE